MGDTAPKRTALAIMQPTYLPYLGYFVLMAAADMFYILDDVQFARQSWQQRNRLLGPGGEQRLSIEVQKKPLHTPIHEIELDDTKPWREKHLLAVESAYHAHPFFTEGFAFFEHHIHSDHTHLASLTSAIIADGARRMGIETLIARTQDIKTSSGRSDRLVSLCEHAKVSDYLSPLGARDYLQSDGVLAEYVSVHYMYFTPEPYDQGRDEFLPYLGFLDAVMSLGFTATGAMIRGRVKPSFPTYF